MKLFNFDVACNCTYVAERKSKIQFPQEHGAENKYSSLSYTLGILERPVLILRQPARFSTD